MMLNACFGGTLHAEPGPSTAMRPSDSDRELSNMDVPVQTHAFDSKIKMERCPGFQRFQGSNRGENHEISRPGNQVG